MFSITLIQLNLVDNVAMEPPRVEWAAGMREAKVWLSFARLAEGSTCEIRRRELKNEKLIEYHLRVAGRGGAPECREHESAKLFVFLARVRWLH